LAKLATPSILFPILFASPIPMEEAMPDTIVARHAITVEDVAYQPGMLARLYRPKGTGPCAGSYTHMTLPTILRV
jgi:hypothetical protein